MRLATIPALCTLFSACNPAPSTSPPPLYFAAELASLETTFTRSQLGTLKADPYSVASVTLGDETRRAFATNIPSEVSFTVDVPPEPRMQLAIAVATLDNEHWSQVRFRILADLTGDNEIVFSEIVERRDRNRWLARDIDVSRWSGQKLRLTFQTRLRPSADSSSPTETLVPLWGNAVLSGAACCDEKPNVVLISIDCLRADHVGAYGYSRDTTPQIDAFAEDAVLFETAVSTAPMTPPSHMSMFTGLFPSLHDGSKFAKLAPSVPYLPEILSQAGYQTDGLVTGAYLSQTYGFEKGFDLYRLDHRSPAAETVKQALELLRLGAGRSQFLFLHLIDAHWPYEPPEELMDRFAPRPSDLAGLLQRVLDNQRPRTPEEIERVVALYDSEIASADEAVGRLLGAMKDMGLYDRSLIIITADHGEAFYDHGHWQHSTTLYEELVRIPLIVKWPGQSPKGRVGFQVSQVDIFTTTLKVAGLPPPPSNGIDLLEFVSGTAESRKRRRVVSENAWRTPGGWARKISIRTEKLKYIVTLAGSPGVEPKETDIRNEELYDLIRDPMEQSNLLPESNSAAEPFRREIGNYLSEARRRRSDRKAERIIEDETTRERLRSLGCIN